MSESNSDGGTLPGKTLRELRARAHGLKPIVWISGHGASESVLKEIDRSLDAHELIKVHAAVDGRRERETLLGEICEALTASPVQIIGKMLVVFRERREEPSPPVARKSASVRRPAKGEEARARGANSAKSRPETPRPSTKQARRTPARKRPVTK